MLSLLYFVVVNCDPVLFNYLILSCLCSLGLLPYYSCCYRYWCLSESMLYCFLSLLNIFYPFVPWLITVHVWVRICVAISSYRPKSASALQHQMLVLRKQTGDYNQSKLTTIKRYLQDMINLQVLTYCA